MAIASFNKVIIGGRLGRAPEIHTFEGGDRVAWLSIATTEQWTSGGARQEKTDWHTAVLFKKAAVTFVERSLRKGDLVMVEGRLENRFLPEGRPKPPRDGNHRVRRPWRHSPDGEGGRGAPGTGAGARPGRESAGRFALMDLLRKWVAYFIPRQVIIAA